MSKLRWNYSVLKKKRVLELIEKHRTDLRVERTSGSDPAYHLEIPGGMIFGRVNAGLVKRWISAGVLIPMEKQRGFINIFDYKFSEHITKTLNS